MARPADRPRATPGAPRMPRRARLVLSGFTGGGPQEEEVRQMAEGARVSSVNFVQDLDRSVNFYTGVLVLEVADRSPTAALRSNAAGARLILREMGHQAPHPLGSVGVQYVIWTARGGGGPGPGRACPHRSRRAPRDAQPQRRDAGRG